MKMSSWMRRGGRGGGCRGSGGTVEEVGVIEAVPIVICQQGDPVRGAEARPHGGGFFQGDDRR